MKESLGRIIGQNKIPLIYVIREGAASGVYDAYWESREDKLIACTLLRGPKFKLDDNTVFSLLSQYIGDGEGKSLVDRAKSSREGRKLWESLRLHYESTSYRDNLAAKATADMQRAHYDGERKNFTLHTYYTIFSDAFNKLDQAGTAHSLNDAQKITGFTNGIRDAEASRCAISARKAMATLPVHEQNLIITTMP